MAFIFAAWPDFADVDLDVFGFGVNAAPSETVLAIRPRLVEYIAGLQGEKKDLGQYWGSLVADHAKFLETVQKGGDAAYLEAIGKIFETPDFGFSQGTIATQHLRTQRPSRLHIATLTLHRAHRLGEAVGVINVKSPENNQRVIPAGDLDRLLSDIEDAVGFRLRSPMINGPNYGLHFRGHYLTFRHFDAIYAAWRMKTILGKSPGAVLEIGGGSGHTAYYARQAGIKDYTILDLPTVSAFQYVIIGAEFGERVRFGGTQDDGITLLNAFNYEAVNFSRYALVLLRHKFLR